LGRFFLDPASGRFYLATWPSPERWVQGVLPPVKIEVLMDDVQQVSWSFFVPPDKGWKPTGSKGNAATKPETPAVTTPTKDKANDAVKPETSQQPTLKPPVEGAWVTEWRQEYKLLPGLVRLIIVSGGNTHQYIFPLSQTERQIVYTQ